MSALQKVPAFAWVALVALVLYVPGLGRFGLWDPAEIKNAEPAREMAEHQSLGKLVFSPDVVQPNPASKQLFPRRPPLSLSLPAIGIRVFGTSELGARLPVLLFGILGAAVLAWALEGLRSRRAALIGGAALLCSPLYLQSSRQLLGPAVLAASLAISLGALARFRFAPEAPQRMLALGLGLAGVGLGYLSGGLLSGVGVPLGALAAASLLCPPEVDDLVGRLTGYGALVATLVVAGTALGGFTAGQWSPFLGGVAHASSWVSFDQVARAAGFGLYPLSAVAPFALGWTALGTKDDPRRGAKLFVLSAAALGLFAAAMQADLALDLGYATLAAPALAIGMFLDEMAESEARVVLGLALAAGTALVARDAFLEPESIVAVHVGETVKWPIELRYGPVLIGLGLAFAGVLAALCALPRLRKLALAGGLVTALASAVFLAQIATPALSKHLSFKSIFDRYHALATRGEPLGGYYVTGHGVQYYAGGQLPPLAGPDALAAFLKNGPAYVLAPSDQLAAIDQALAQRVVDYRVADASSSRFLLLTSADVPDENPLRKFVSKTPPPAGKKLAINFEDKVELVGVDVPAESSRAREGKIPLTLHFLVKAPVGGTFKIFLHLDSPAARVLGDHDPLGGRYPTTYWTPGRYVSDHYDVDIPLMTTTPGVYTIYGGFFSGDRRLKVTSGAQDGADRALIGTVTIR